MPDLTILWPRLPSLHWRPIQSPKLPTPTAVPMGRYRRYGRFQVYSRRFSMEQILAHHLQPRLGQIQPTSTRSPNKIGHPDRQ